MGKLTHKKQIESHREKKTIFLMLTLTSILIFLSINLVSSDLISHYNFRQTTGNLTDQIGDLDFTMGGYFTNDEKRNEDGDYGFKGYFFNGTKSFIHLNDSAQPFQGTAGSVSIWMKPNINSSFSFPGGTVPSHQLISTGTATGSITSNDNGFIINYGGEVYRETTNLLWEINQTIMFTFTWDTVTDNYKTYINDTEFNASTINGASFVDANITIGSGNGGIAPFWNGTIYDMKFYDNILTASEISNLFFEVTTFPTVTAIDPADNTNITIAGKPFVAYFNMTSGNDLRNATYYIWYTNGTVFNNSVFVGLAGTDDIASQDFDGFILGDYEWNFFTCFENATSDDCKFAASNFTFTVDDLVEVSQTFNVNSTEGNSELISINISYDSSHFTNIQGTLVYNNTKFIGAQVDSGIYSVFSTTVVAPVVSADSNIPFYWEFILNNGTDITINSTFQNQTVSNIGIDDCTTNTNLILNLTLRDEGNQSTINGAQYNTFINVNVDIRATSGTETLIAFSQNYTSLSNASVCFSNDLSNSTYDFYAQIQYGADTYATEFYNIQNFTLTNETTTTIPINIDLFDLLDEDSQTFLVTYKDESFLPVENALIDIQRKYVDEGVFKTVEIPQTDVNGQTTGHFQLEGTLYTITITKNGEILAIFDNTAVVCQDQIIGDCRLNLNAFSSTTDFTDWTTDGGITYDMTFDESARTIVTTFTTTNGGTKTVLLNVTKYDRFSNTTICGETLTSSSGTLTCNIPASFGNVTLESRLFSNGDLITRRIYRIAPNAGDYFGAANAGIMILIMIITIPLMLTTSTIGVLLGIIVGMIMAVLLGLYTGGSLIGVSSAVMWLIIAAGIIIWKIAKRGGG